VPDVPDDPLDPAALRELLARAALRDQTAFAELYRRCSPKLFAQAARILRNDDQAEEVLQDAFVSIWNHATDYAPGKSAPMTWMTAIVRNRALDLVRRPKSEIYGEDSDELAAALPDAAAGPLELLLDGRSAAVLRDCLGSIEPRQRQTIALAFYQGLTHSELAAHLCAPLGSVKTWIRRGLLRLRDCMDARAPGGV
jgi:RNA polymerase sigma-70 factor (ECF subfamily)